jgi:hypothetical protein
MDDVYKAKVADQLRKQGMSPQQIAEHLSRMDEQAEYQRDISFHQRATHDLQDKLQHPQQGVLFGPDGKPL